MQLVVGSRYISKTTYDRVKEDHEQVIERLFKLHEDRTGTMPTSRTEIKLYSDGEETWMSSEEDLLELGAYRRTATITHVTLAHVPTPYRIEIWSLVRGLDTTMATLLGRDLGRDLGQITFFKAGII